MVSRRNWLWSTLVTSASVVSGCAAQRGTGSAATAPEATSATAQLVLRDYISVDVHSHAGATGVTSRGTPPNSDLAQGMRAGGMATVCLADVPDGPLLGRRPNGVLGATRSAAPDELYRYHLDRLSWIDELVARHGVRRALTVADLKAAHATGQPAIVEDIEGLDFLEGKLERLEESWEHTPWRATQRAACFSLVETRSNWAKASYECERDARLAVGSGGRKAFREVRSLAEQCMVARGYSKLPAPR